MRQLTSSASISITAVISKLPMRQLTYKVALNDDNIIF